MNEAFTRVGGGIQPADSQGSTDEGRVALSPRIALERLCAFYEALTPETLGGIDQYYASGASFKDPFNEVIGVPAIEAIFRAMFSQLDAPRFLIRSTLLEGERACIVWDLEFRFRGSRSAPTQRIHGASWIEFSPDGKVARHRDYWDAAEELYEKIPVLGALMRMLRRRLAH